MTLPDWFYQPQTVYTTILAIGGCLISIYSQDIRVLLTKRWGTVQKLRLTKAVNELALLDSLHQNTYGLLLWVLYQVTSAVLFCVGLYIMLRTIQLAYHTRDWTYAIGGILFGRFVLVTTTIEHLMIYDRKKARLEQRIAKLKADPTSTVTS